MHVGVHVIPVPYKVRGYHKLPILYLVSGTIRVISDMKTLHIDSYKVPTVDSNHIIHVGGMACPCP